MIDLHCHLLPNLDDGSRSLEQSAAVLRQFFQDGITQLVLTPHITSSEIERGGVAKLQRRDQAIQELTGVTPEGLSLHVGFEIMIDGPVPRVALGDRRWSLAGSRYYLVEFPPSVVGPFATRALDEITRAGATPLLAHPERYQACTTRQAAEWKEAGAKLQVDATTLTRPTIRGRLARQLVAAGLADVLAADNHGDRRSLRRAVIFLREEGKGDARDLVIDHLTERNPAAVLADQTLEAVPPLKLVESWTDRLRYFLSG